MNKNYIVNIYRFGFKLILAVIFLMIFFANFYAQDENWYEQANERIEEIRKGDFSLTINDYNGNPISDSIYIKLIKHEFPWGNVIPPLSEDVDNDWTQAALLKYFNAGIAENFKWNEMEFTKGSVFYNGVDTIYKWGEKVGWNIRAHTLLWGGQQNWQMPGWLLDGGYTGQQIYNECETRIKRDVPL